MILSQLTKASEFILATILVNWQVREYIIESEVNWQVREYVIESEVTSQE